MKRLVSMFLSLSLVALLTVAAAGATHTTAKKDMAAVSLSQSLSDVDSQAVVGQGLLGDFLTGVACGAGIVGGAVAFSTGVGAVAGVALVAATTATCAKALGL